MDIPIHRVPTNITDVSAIRKFEIFLHVSTFMTFLGTWIEGADHTNFDPAFTTFLREFGSKCSKTTFANRSCEVSVLHHSGDVQILYRYVAWFSHHNLMDDLVLIIGSDEVQLRMELLNLQYTLFDVRSESSSSSLLLILKLPCESSLRPTQLFLQSFVFTVYLK